MDQFRVGNVTIRYQGVSQSIEVDLDDDYEIFSFQIYSLFDLPTTEQLIEGLVQTELSAPLRASGIKIGGDYTVSKKSEKLQKIQTMLGQLQHSTGEMEMRRSLLSDSVNVMQYEDSELQRKTLSIVPVEEIKKRATNNPAKLPDPRDEFILQLLRWFKLEFFQWVNAPPCQFCQGKCQSVGAGAPSEEEKFYGAGRVEVYVCTICQQQTRFPRYNKVQKLLETRRGRCGEWANCFTGICRALGYDARYVHDWTDHVWTEVWSESRKEWVHCDSCEAKWDAPLLYEVGWNKKLSYVIAFSADEVVDVSKRYTNDFQQLLTRRLQCSEEFLAQQIDIMNQAKLASMTPTKIHFLNTRRQLETLTLNTPKAVKSEELGGRESGTPILPHNTSSGFSPSFPGGRESGSVEWREQRGEIGKIGGQPLHQIELKNASIVFDWAKFDLSEKRKGFSLNGTANLTTDGQIELTPNRNDCRGSIWHNCKVDLQRNWKVTFMFKIGPRQGADGFAFVVQSVGLNALGGGGGAKGYAGIPNSVAIEFDTYESVQELNDPNDNHISIHTKGKEANSANHRFSIACSGYNLPRISDGRNHFVTVLYLNHTLDVFMDSQQTPVCSAKIDLSETIGSKDGFLGFTAATGGISQAHYILNWDFSQALPPLFPYFNATDCLPGSCTVPPSDTAVTFNNIPILKTISAADSPIPPIITKLTQFNNQLEQLSDSEIATIHSFGSLLETKHFESQTVSDAKAIFQKIQTNWPKNNIFPIIDLIRMSLLHPIFGKEFFQKDYIDFMKAMLFDSSSAHANPMLATKYFTNSFQLTTTNQYEILNSMVQVVKKTENVNLLRACSNFLLNCAISYQSDKCVDFLDCCEVLLQSQDGTVLFTSLLALGTLMLKDPIPRAEAQLREDLGKRVTALVQYEVQKIRETAKEVKHAMEIQ